MLGDVASCWAWCLKVASCCQGQLVCCSVLWGYSPRCWVILAYLIHPRTAWPTALGGCLAVCFGDCQSYPCAPFLASTDTDFRPGHLLCAAGSIAASDCTCPANFYGTNNVCTACNADATSPAGECQQPSILTCRNAWRCGKLLGLVPESC